ncbi:MAG TPA: YciI family protein [Haliangiales bacterium]|nr:YciI family protein [Haliangiales bacterium]
MRFLITAGPSGDGKSPPDDPSDMRLLAAYMKFNEDMTKAGVLIASEGLNPLGARARVAVAGGRRRVVDGPFAEAKELIGGLYLIDVASREEAIEWALRCPVGLGITDVLEIYQMTDIADLPLEMRELIAHVAPTWSASMRRAKLSSVG